MDRPINAPQMKREAKARMVERNYSLMVMDTASGPENLGFKPDCHLLAPSNINNDNNNKSNY